MNKPAGMEYRETGTYCPLFLNTGEGGSQERPFSVLTAA
jgi:hypothetical protein